MLRDVQPNESSPVYLLTSDDKYTVCGMDFSPESTSSPKIFSGGDFQSPAGQRKRSLSLICSCGTWRLETPPYDDTQSQTVYKRT